MLDIQIASRSDAAELARLAIAFRNHLQNPRPTDVEFSRNVERLLASEDAEFYLGVARGQSVGYLLQRFRFSMWASGMEAHIEDLFVDPGERGSGFGKALVRFALDRARTKGCVSACLDTNENNAASQRIYQGLGFNAFSKRWGGRQVFYRMNF